MKIIKYTISYDINKGTEQEPDMKPVYQEQCVPWSEKNEEFARKASYNREITIEEIPDEPNNNYIPTPEQSAISMVKSVFISQTAEMDTELILQCSGLAPDWFPGAHKTGEVYNVDNQTWECLADYDNGEHPDVVPGNSAWFTFNRPYHGRTPETARPWVKPENGTTDIYHSGEYMVFTDGHTNKAKRDTNYSPEEYPADWEKVD